MLSVPHSLATQYSRRTDQEIVALDARSGTLLWKHQEAKLSSAYFEVCNGGLIVHPVGNSSDKSNPVFLDLQTGKSIRPFRIETKSVLAKSFAKWPPPPVRLQNGWTLHNFRPGYSMNLEFADPGADRVMWTVKTHGYPQCVRAWQNLVIWSFSSQSDAEAVLYAYRAGDRLPLWTADLNRIIPPASDIPLPSFGHDNPEVPSRLYGPLKQMTCEVIDNRVYVQARQHIFAFDSLTGKLFWHRDLAHDLHVNYYPEIEGDRWMQDNYAAFTKDGNIIIIAFDKRVVALDLSSMKYLWTLEPDTFIHLSFPVICNGRVFLVCGPRMHLNSMAGSR